MGEVPQLKGCYSEGETLDELMASIREAIQLCLDDAQEDSGRFLGVQRVLV